MEIFFTALNQVVVMFAFLSVGFLLRKSGKLPDNASKILSTILVYICMPALSFSTCANNMTVENFKNQGKTVLIGLVVLGVGFVLALVLSKVFAKSDFERKVYTYSFTIPNLGYMGYPMVEAVFGSETLFHMMMFVLPMNIFIYTKGIAMLSSDRKTGIKGLITQPVLIALAAGIVVGLSGITLPKLVTDITGSASNCMAPLAMMLTGAVIAGRPLKELLKGIRPYLASLIRLIVLPVMALAIMQGLKVPAHITTVAVATLAMPLGLNTVVFPEAYGGDGSIGARLAFISHTLAVATIPVIFGIISNFVK